MGSSGYKQQERGGHSVGEENKGLAIMITQCRRFWTCMRSRSLFGCDVGTSNSILQKVHVLESMTWYFLKHARIRGVIL